MTGRTAQAAVVVAPEQIEIQPIELPDPSAGEVRLRLEGCRVCTSNIPPWEGRPWFKYPLQPGQLGHEGWGRVEALGPGVKGVSVGERVTFISERAYAEYENVPSEALVPIPSFLEGQPVPGEPLGCAINIFRRAAMQPGQTVAIVGIGFLGALVITISRRPFALELAYHMGAETALVSGDRDRSSVVEEVTALTGGDLCECVIEATGKQAPLDLAADLVGVRGRLVVAGYHQDGPRQVNRQQWNWRGIDVINAHDRDIQIYRDGMRAALEALVAGTIDLTRLYTHMVPLSQLGTALDLIRKRPDGFMKALVIYD